MNAGALAVAFMTLAASASAQALSALELMQRLATVPASQASFTETRHSSLLKTPLVVTGRLVYRRPDRLEKHVQSPFIESTVIDGSRLSMTRGGDAGRTMNVPAGPAQALVESLRATLAGDLAALERHFNVHLQGNLDAWTLTLIPREAALADVVTRVEIAGNDANLRRIEVLEASGDRSVTVIDGAK